MSLPPSVHRALCRYPGLTVGDNSLLIMVVTACLCGSRTVSDQPTMCQEPALLYSIFLISGLATNMPSERARSMPRIDDNKHKEVARFLQVCAKSKVCFDRGK